MRRFGRFSEIKGETNIEEYQMIKRLNSNNSGSNLNNSFNELLNLPNAIDTDESGNYVDARTGRRLL